jgi:hypothetical protein
VPQLGLNAGRADDAVGSDLVILKIAQFIEEAELIICDLTYERPNIYYELGYAHGVGNRGDRILLIAREDTPRHFDINGLHTRLYSSLDNLRTILQTNLPPMISGLRQSPTIGAITPAGAKPPASSTLDPLR